MIKNVSRECAKAHSLFCIDKYPYGVYTIEIEADTHMGYY